MIKKETLSKDWIMQFRKDPGLKKCDPALIEKMTFAFYLLENLTLQNIDFVFKGGTSLILITNENNRFSVDIDIIPIKFQYDLYPTQLKTGIMPMYIELS